MIWSKPAKTWMVLPLLDKTMHWTNFSVVGRTCTTLICCEEYLVEEEWRENIYENISFKSIFNMDIRIVV